MTSTPLQVCEIEYWGDTAARLNHHAKQPWFVLLDSCRFSGANGRYDIAVWKPKATLVTRGRHTVVTVAEQQYESGADPFSLVREFLNNEPRHSHLPFTGGAVGFYGYDLGRRIENLPDHAIQDINLPDMAVGIYEQGLVVDHQQARAWFMHRGLSPTDLASELNLLAPPRTLTPPTLGSNFVVTAELKADISFADYARAFSAIKQYIHDGDCYQVNYAQRFSAPATGDPWDAYRRLRLQNSAPYAGFVRIPDGAVLCSSPERFIEVRGGQVESKPIKGTRARSSDLVADAAAARELLDSDKDRAENLMIVDLLRNDIGKACEIGSVRVSKLFDLESFATVHHLVSTVNGQLRAGTDPLDLLRACFPGGSITGAPKLRAMEIIEELEGTRRNVYCGALGYVSCDGQMDTNITIRTLAFADQRLYCWAGGGIVMDSEVDDEYQESLDKASAMFSVFNDAQIR